MNKGYYYDDEGRLCYSHSYTGVEVITVYPLEMNRRDWRKYLYRHTVTKEIKPAGVWADEHAARRGQGLDCSDNWAYGLERYKDISDQVRKAFDQGE